MSGVDKFFGSLKYTDNLRNKIEKESGLNISYDSRPTRL